EVGTCILLDFRCREAPPPPRRWFLSHRRAGQPRGFPHRLPDTAGPRTQRTGPVWSRSLARDTISAHGGFGPCHWPRSPPAALAGEWAARGLFLFAFSPRPTG